jgi:hypothetical protein
MYITSRKARQEIKMGVSETKIMYFFGWLKVSSLVDDVVVASEWGFLFCEARRVEESGMDSFSFRFIADPVGDFFPGDTRSHSLTLALARVWTLFSGPRANYRAQRGKMEEKINETRSNFESFRCENYWI